MCFECDQREVRLSRRGLLAAGAAAGALALAACFREPEKPAPATQSRLKASTRPKHPAPDLGAEMFPDARGRPVCAAGDAPVIMVPRSAWTKSKTDLADVFVMNGVNRITVHHTGIKHVYDTDSWKETVAAIGGIRTFHTTDKDREWADIAYHYIIDHVGRVWQGRPLAYQGAHAKLQNEHNVGIVVMGNFEQHFASAAQLTSLGAFITFLREIYAIPLKNVFTHGELGKTECPGRTLQTYMNRARLTWSTT